MIRGSSMAIAALASLALPAGAAAQAAGIRVVEVDSVRVDGSLGDWRGARFTPVGQGTDASMRFALGHDDEGLYVAAMVFDERLVRTSSPGAREDAVILTLSMPQRRGRRAVDLFLFAGVSGRGAASAGLGAFGRRPRPLSGVRIVEGPLRRGRGYVLEAFVPFSVLPGGERWEEARANIRYRDVDQEARPEVESEPALIDGVDARHLDRLVPLMATGGASGALGEFLNARGLGAARPSHDLRGDVAEDGRPERVFVVDRFLVITGPGYRGGSGYGYHQLPIEQASDVRDAELRDLTGDGQRELVIVLRQRNAQGERDLWQVMDLSGDSPRAIFGLEIRKAVTGSGSVEARVRVLRARRGAPEIEVRAHRASGLDAESYQEAPAADVEPILLPWGPIRARRYRWSGRGFEQTTEQANPRYRPPAPERATREAAPTEPAAPTEEQLLAAFRREARIRRGARPRFRMQANFAGDRAQETGLVYGRQLVIVGPGIQGGRSFLTYSIPAPTDDDLLDVSAADVTGDGRAELLFRVRQRFGEVEREVLAVHQVTERGFPRLLEVEVKRTQGDRVIENQVVARRGRLEIRPGRAVGWDASSWTFTRSEQDSAEPLLLPWQDRAVRYRLRGGRLAR